jgi:hypothetical protein
LRWPKGGWRSWGGGRRVAVDEEFLIVDFCLLIDNWDAPLGFNPQSKVENQRLDSLGRRLMVGQVPLEHFV